MFHNLRSKTPSPCPSPVQDLVTNIRGHNPKPKRGKYKTMIESQEPIISRGRLTMTGGFQDFRPTEYPFTKEDSFDSDDTTSPSTSATTSRSGSCDSNDPIMDPTPTKMQRRFVKIPRKALKNVIQQLSPRLSKRLMQEEKKYDAFTPQHPMWPNVMATYARGVSTTPVQSLITPAQPSLTAMKARAILEDKRNVRAALQMLAMDVNQRQISSLSDDSSCTSSSYNSDQEDAEENLKVGSSPQRPSINDEYEPANIIAKNLMEFHLNKPEGVSEAEVFPVNPKIQVNPCSSPNSDESSEDDFQEESIFDALDLETLPTVSPDDILCQSIHEVRNVHLCREYIILETGPPTDSIFV